MAVKAIAHSYWRSIKRGNRTFSHVPVEMQNDVRTLARTEVESGLINAKEYERYIGKE